MRDDQIDKIIAVESGGQTLAGDLRREGELLRRRQVRAARPRGPLTFEEATALHRNMEGELGMPKSKNTDDEEERGQHIDEALDDLYNSGEPGFIDLEGDTSAGDEPATVVEPSAPNATNIADAVMKMVDPAFASATARLDAAIAAASEMKVLLAAHQTNVRSVLEERDRYVRDLLTAAAQLERRVADETDAIMASLGNIGKDYKIDKAL